jgi:helix-turn-helix protein
MMRKQSEPPKTLDVATAGKQYFNLSRGGSYAAAARGDIPTVRIGRKIRVPVIALERMLDQAKPRRQSDEAA